MQSHELVIVGYESLQSTYFPRLSQIAVLICSADILKKDKPAQDLCAIGIAQALMNGAAPSFVDGMFEYYTGNVIEKFPTPMKTAIGEAAKIASARQVFEFGERLHHRYIPGKMFVDRALHKGGDPE